ncbi:MAG: glycerol acyltransferase [Bacteroidetes bacterium]|nr:glycerol acyltransferase [Bacteroidota bacterium]
MDKLIDIDKVIFSKSPKLLKLLPKFLLSYIKKIVHEDEMNDLLSKNPDLKNFDFIEWVLFDEFGASVNSTGLGHITQNGRYILAANHPLGGPDGLALMNQVATIRKDLIFPVNDLLMNLPSLKQLFIPLNKHGSNSDNVRVINETFASNVILLYFPAGLVSRKKSGHISDLPWKQTFVTKAKRFKRDIIPVHINGRNSNFFYNLANLRKFFGIKANIEMLYLVNEMYKQRDKTINITFGKPIPYQTLDKRMTNTNWAEKIRMHVYELEANPDIQFNY